MAAKILIVEDEDAIRSFIRVNLKRHNFEIIEAASGEEALEKADASVDIALLDVMLPGIDGFEVCRKIRETYPAMGIIMLTAKGQEQNKIEGLELGADDYMVKPFSPKELLARINALLRRISLADKQVEEENNAIHSGIFTILQDERKLLKNGQEIELTPIEFDILYLLASNPGRVFSTDEIFEKVWNEKVYEANNTVMVHIRRLRGKMKEDTRQNKIITTVWGVGYKIEK